MVLHKFEDRVIVITLLLTLIYTFHFSFIFSLFLYFFQNTKCAFFTNVSQKFVNQHMLKSAEFDDLHIFLKNGAKAKSIIVLKDLGQ